MQCFLVCNWFVIHGMTAGSRGGGAVCLAVLPSSPGIGDEQSGCFCSSYLQDQDGRFGEGPRAYRLAGVPEDSRQTDLLLAVACSSSPHENPQVGSSLVPLLNEDTKSQGSGPRSQSE